jgi:hypothetical protein
MANFSVQNFIKEVQNRDLARVNLFEVTITPPPALTFFDDQRIISLFCDSTSLPSQKILTKRHTIYGETEPRPYSVDFGSTINLTFVLDASMHVRSFFDRWMDMVVDRDSNNVNYQSYYVGGLRVAQLRSKEHTEAYAAEFVGAFPIAVNLLPVDNNQSNIVHRMDVTFEYRKWNPLVTS